MAASRDDVLDARRQGIAGRATIAGNFRPASRAIARPSANECKRDGRRFLSDQFACGVRATAQPSAVSM